MKQFEIGNIRVGNDLPFSLIAGPCAIESLDHSLFMAEQITKACENAGVQFIYKSSFDKANRSAVSSERGIGIDQGLEILAKVKTEFGCSILTDIHEPGHCAKVAEVADVLQIPAFLCRQTDLLLAAGNTGAAINVKKGQFLAPWDMTNVADKLASTGNERIMLCERGTSFGYNTLVSDFRSLPTMAETGYPVVFDATHSVQQPGGNGKTTGGDRRFVPVLARAAVAVGCAMLFMETHQDPDSAPSDGPNMVYLDKLEEILKSLKRIEAARMAG